MAIDLDRFYCPTCGEVMMEQLWPEAEEGEAWWRLECEPCDYEAEGPGGRAPALRDVLEGAVGEWQADLSVFAAVVRRAIRGGDCEQD